MEQTERYLIYDTFFKCFGWMDSSEVSKLMGLMMDDVLKDIKETADPENWHSGDIEISIKRVLLQRLGID